MLNVLEVLRRELEEVLEGRKGMKAPRRLEGGWWLKRGGFS